MRCFSCKDSVYVISMYVWDGRHKKPHILFASAEGGIKRQCMHSYWFYHGQSMENGDANNVSEERRHNHTGTNLNHLWYTTAIVVSRAFFFIIICFYLFEHLLYICNYHLEGIYCSIFHFFLCTRTMIEFMSDNLANLIVMCIINRAIKVSLKEKYTIRTIYI